MINKKIQNFSLIEIFLVISYSICWFSISTSFYDVNNFFVKKNTNLNELINFLRQSLNLLIFPVLILFFFKKIKNINFKNELFFISALAYFFFQIEGQIRLYVTPDVLSLQTHVTNTLRETQQFNGRVSERERE